MTVTVYSKPNCPQCEHTKRDMERLGIAYQSVDLSREKAQLQRLIDAGHRSAPVVETDSGTWSGYDELRIRNLATPPSASTTSSAA